MRLTHHSFLVRLGIALVGFSGLVVTGTSPGLGLSDVALAHAEIIGGAAIVVALAALAVPSARWGSRGLLLFPFAVTAMDWLLGVGADHASQSFISLLSLSVLYIGLTQPRWSTAWFLPLLVFAWWPAYPAHNLAVLIRLPLAISVWVLVGELLALYAAQQREHVAGLRVIADTDPLTGLLNRRALDRSLAVAQGVTVVFCDLDHFKAYNDEHGHGAGDQILKQFADVLQATVRAGDLAVRVGGEEFVVITDGSADGSELDRRLRAAWEAEATGLTFSSGAATQAGAETVPLAMERADQALYAAKAAGRNQLVVAAPPREIPAQVASPHRMRAGVRISRG